MTRGLANKGRSCLNAKQQAHDAEGSIVHRVDLLQLLRSAVERYSRQHVPMAAEFVS